MNSNSKLGARFYTDAMFDLVAGNFAAKAELAAKLSEDPATLQEEYLRLWDQEVLSEEDEKMAALIAVILLNLPPPPDSMRGTDLVIRLSTLVVLEERSLGAKTFYRARSIHTPEHLGVWISSTSVNWLD